jgi:periplasmic divalent cation tolerance protein
MDDIVILYTTWTDADTAERAAQGAVEAGLAACANILGPMTAIYRWQGQVERAGEVVMILKTGTARAAALTESLARGHPYETPAIVAIPVLASASWAPFLLWIAEEAAQA